MRLMWKILYRFLDVFTPNKKVLGIDFDLLRGGWQNTLLQKVVKY